jgi:2-hydroxy-3-keto-5-methylthiopentenyl-1-phosphate phosphatase
MTKAEQFIADMTRLRGMDFVRIGMVVEVNGERGKIIGMNMSANLDVVFDDHEKHGKHAHNCHPEWETRYFNDKGECIADYREGVQHGGPHSV